jgi:hypothetical protein
MSSKTGLDRLVGRLRLHVESLYADASAKWTGFYSAAGNGEREPVLQPATGFPFHTQAATKVWQAIQQLAKQQPQATLGELIKGGLEASGVSVIALTPEDTHLLELAANWLVTGRVAPQQAAPEQAAPEKPPATHYLARKGYP